VERLSGEQVSARKKIKFDYVVEFMRRGFRVGRRQHMARTYTVFKIVERSTILGFSLHLIAAVYADDPGEAFG